ncbi:hypothetical protein DVH24_034198 [Malus domestica]|uniref:Rab-GAP TBC domain-containing protein n=1 Tax=Malus domestica TaxID=3750 RepID=A0A498IBN7_MALDO|nr:hypothetical protein DVH24_034198 [Malus domestica]
MRFNTLYGSLWSSSTPSPSIDDDLVQRYTSNPTAAATTTPISSYSVSDYDPPSTVDPPIPVAPPKSTREDKHLPEPQFSDSFPHHEDKSNNTAPSPEDISRQSQLLAELSREVINLRELRRISSQGIPDGAGIRSTVWKLLLGYLPPDRGLWLSELAKKRSQYKHFKDELLMNPHPHLRYTHFVYVLMLHRPTFCAIQHRRPYCRPIKFSLELQWHTTVTQHAGCTLPLHPSRLYSIYSIGYVHGVEEFSLIVKGLHKYIGSNSPLSEITRKMDNCTTCDNDELKCQGKGLLSRSEIPHGEHPLSLGKSSVWNQFFQDKEIIEQIDRDVKRTHPDMHFFSGDSQDAKSNQDALKTILVIFAKLNPGIRYVQGMNEILAPLFYVLKNDPNEEDAASAEADTFFCFVELLSGFRDHFCQQLDNSVVGIRSTITRLSQLLKEHDEELWRHLEITTKVNPQFYAFRWITLLLTQEFNFTDSHHIWDTLLSDPEGPQETLLRVCCAMLILIRRRLLAGDFTSNLKLLQNYPPTNISHLLYVANKLRSYDLFRGLSNGLRPNGRVKILEIQELDDSVEQMEQRAMVTTCRPHQLYCY